MSETDREELEKALNIVSTLSFGQLKRLTHEDPAYKEAWDKRGKMKQAEMNMALMLESEDAELIEDLAYVSSHSANV